MSRAASKNGVASSNGLPKTEEKNSVSVVFLDEFQFHVPQTVTASKAFSFILKIKIFTGLENKNVFPFIADGCHR